MAVRRPWFEDVAVPDLSGLAAEIDGELDERALVVGSAPDDARDLDLLVGAGSVAALERRLADRGFAPCHGSWRRAGATVEVVDVDPVDTWALPAQERHELFHETAPLPGLRHLAVPGPASALLILARRLASSDGRLDARRLGRAQAALESDPDAAGPARRRAPRWGCSGALELLLAAVDGRDVPRRDAVRLTAGDRVRLRGAVRTRLGRLRSARLRRGALVAVSGLDGAGKTTQTEALVTALESAGYEAVLLWDRIGYELVLARIGRAGTSLLAPVRQRRPVAGPGVPLVPPTSLPSAQPPLPPPTSAPLLARNLWVGLVVTAHVTKAGWGTWRHVHAGRVVVRDRWLLDAVVHLHDRYGDQLAVEPWARVLGMLLPRPQRAYLLDLAPEEALRRKTEQFDLPQLTRLRTAYLAHLDDCKVVRLDADRPRDELAAGLVRDVLTALEARGVDRRR